jgi:hypothetical protein
LHAAARISNIWKEADMFRHRWLLVGLALALLLTLQSNDRAETAGTAVLTDPEIVVRPAPLPPQPPGVAFTDPAFGTTLRRITSASDEGGFGTHIYSQLQAFSPDNTLLLLIESERYVVRRVDDTSAVSGLNTAGWNAPRWHPKQPGVIVHYDSNDDDILRLQLTDIDSLETTTVFTFPAPYTRIRGNQSFDELSRDGRWAAGMASSRDGEQIIFALDLEDGALGAQMTVSEFYAGPCRPDPEWGLVEPDWIGVSPLGDYLIIQWPRDGTERCSGLETFDIRSGAFAGRVSDGHQHGDLGLAADGRTQFFMTFEIYHPSGRLALGIRELPGDLPVSRPHYVQVTDWNGEHISCQGPPGVCLVSMSADPADGWSALEGELFLQYLDGSILRLAHHRSTSCGYWVQPRASLSADGRYVVFASDWASGTDNTGCDGGDDLGRGDVYMIDLMPG